MQITAITADGKTKGRIYLDGTFRGFLYNREVTQLGLTEGRNLTEEEWGQIETQRILPRGKKKALDLLLMQERCEKELRGRILGAGYTEEQTEAVMAYVKQYPYLDDVRYALHYFTSAGRRKSLMQMRFELRRKGVSDEDIRAAYDKYLAERQEEENGRIALGKGADLYGGLNRKKGYAAQRGEQEEGTSRDGRAAEQATLRKLMEKKLKGRTPEAEEQEKLFACFARKGFRGEDIRKVMKEFR